VDVDEKLLLPVMEVVGEPSKESGSVTLSFGAVLAIGGKKVRSLIGGGGGGVSGGKDAMDPSKGGAAVDDDCVRESSSRSSNNHKCNDAELSVRSIVTNRKGEVGYLFSYTHGSHINSPCLAASTGGPK
jgi:hypothetical protein